MATKQQQNQEKVARTILLVDDDPDIRSLIRTFLEHEGYLVYTSGDAERASQIFRRTPGIDLLITDYSMSDRTGLELARDLKRRRSSLPVLIISGQMMESIERTQMELHGFKFLPKPFSLPSLLSEVHEIMQPSLPAEVSATLSA
jgi:CheY-like chemotaxis protein